MASEPVVHVTIKLANRKAVRALKAVAELAAEIAEDQPWNDQAKRLAKAARYALENVTLEVRQG